MWGLYEENCSHLSKMDELKCRLQIRNHVGRDSNKPTYESFAVTSSCTYISIVSSLKFTFMNDCGVDIGCQMSHKHNRTDGQVAFLVTNTGF